MKKMKIIPLLMAFPLLVACNNNGVKSMKKPSFAKYSNKVAEVSTFYQDYEKAGEEAIKANFVMKDDAVASLDKGAVINGKGYESVELEAKLANGNKQSYSTKRYSEGKAEYDADKLAGKMVTSMNMLTKATNLVQGASVDFYEVGSQKGAILTSIPSFSKGSIESGGAIKAEEYNFFKDNKTVSADAMAKTYTIGSLAIDDEAARKQLIAYSVASQVWEEAEDFCPTNHGIVEYDRYEDGKVYTSVFSVQATDLKVTYSSGKEYNVKSTYEAIYQANFEKLTFLSSEETTIEMSGPAGTFKYVAKSYATIEMQNKKVSVKTPDLAKYVDVSPTLSV